MEKKATLNLRVDPVVKQRAENVLNKLGIPMSTAINIYLNQISLTGGIPFDISLPKAPPELNMDLMSAEQIHAELKKGYDEAMAGEIKSIEEAFPEYEAEHRDEAV